jgi:colicin import membrane protein
MIMHKFSYLKRLVQFILVVALLNSSLTMASAAGDWDSALDDINELHGKYTSLQAALKSEVSTIQMLRKENNETLKSIHAVIASTDKALLTRLSSEATSAQKKHAPLLEQYSTLGKQSTTAKKARDFKRATLLDLRRNKLKAAVTIARTEIKAKTDALATARKQTVTKTKPIKDALAPITALKKQITTENKNITVAQKVRSEADKRYKLAVKQGDAITAATSMRASYEQMVHIHSLQQKIYSWEQKIALALRAAESKLP